jgi:hypothetical protein
MTTTSSTIAVPAIPVASLAISESQVVHGAIPEYGDIIPLADDRRIRGIA